MHFVLQTPSLQHVARVKIVTTLLNHDDILIDILEGKKIEDEVQSKLSALPLPQRCKKKLVYLVKPLGNEITAWCRSNCYRRVKNNYFKCLDIVLDKQLLRWTMRGTVDYAKTAELLVKDESLDIENRYEVACINCLENEARRLIRLIPQERKPEYIDRARNLSGVECHVLITYFTCAFSGQGLMEPMAAHFQCPRTQFRNESINKRLFREMLCRGHRATSEYFFQKLSPREKKQVLAECQEGMLRYYPEPSTCKSMYYLSLMNKEQQRHMFERYTSVVLHRLLGWPMQSLFVEAAECGWRYMSKYQCSSVLRAIIDKINDGFEDYDYVQLFRECWRLSGDDCKQHLLFDRNYLVNLIQTKEDELVKLILNEAPSFQILKFFKRINDNIRQMLSKESVISDAALMECKQTAALNSSNDPQDEEKRLRSQYLSRLVDVVMKSREKRKRGVFG